MEVVGYARRRYLRYSLRSLVLEPIIRRSKEFSTLLHRPLFARRGGRARLGKLSEREGKPPVHDAQQREGARVRCVVKEIWAGMWVLLYMGLFICLLYFITVYFTDN